MITVTVIKTYQWSQIEDWPPEDAKGFVEWFAKKLLTIPPEFADATRIQLGYEIEDGPTIEITYGRPETYDEVCQRKLREVEQRVFIEQVERKQLAALEKKYGNKK